MRTVHALVAVLVAILSPGAPGQSGEGLPEGATVRLGSTNLRHFGEDPGHLYATRAMLVRFAGDDRLVSVGTDGTIGGWSASSGARIFGWTLDGLGGAAISATGDRLAAIARGQLSIRDVATGEIVRAFEVPPATAWTIRRIALAPDGSLLAAAAGREILVYDARTGAMTAKLAGHEEEVDLLAFHPDGKRLASAGEEGRVVVWDAASGAIVEDVRFESEGTYAIGFSPDGAAIAIVSRDEPDWRTARLRLRRFAAGAEPEVVHAFWVAQGVAMPQRDLAFSPDGTRIATQAPDGSLSIVDLAGRREIATAGARSHALAWSADGARVALGCEGAVRVVDAASGDRVLGPVGHVAAVRLLAWSPDGSAIWTADAHELLTWRLERPAAPEGEPWTGEGLLAVNLAGGATFAVYGAAGELQFVDREGGIQWTADAETYGYSTPTRAAFSRDGKLAAVGFDGGAIHVWDLEGRTRVAELAAHTDAVRALDVSPDGSLLASGSKDESVALWALAEGTLVRRWGDHGNWVNAVAFTPDGATVLAACGSGEVFARDPAADAPRWRAVVHEGPVMALAVSPDGRRLATGDDSGALAVVSCASGERRTLRRAGAGVRSLRFRPDGGSIASGLSDGTVLLWEVRAE